MEYKLPYPKVDGRVRLHPAALHRGSVVAFRSYRYDYPRTGILVMLCSDWMLLAVNLYEEEGRIWYEDALPEDLELYVANEEEVLWGLKNFFCYLYLDDVTENDIHPLIKFIDRECPQGDTNNYKRGCFCLEMLTRAPYIIRESEYSELKNALNQRIVQAAGLQYDRYQTEYYCFLMGVLMIVENEQNNYQQKTKIEQLRRNWEHFSWMYGIGIGRVLGSGLHNFTAVINSIAHNYRKHYLHLYLPLIELFFDKICKYSDDKREKLQDAIKKAKGIEASEKQNTELDELYGILFPKHSLEALSSNRPAATIAEMRQEIAAKERKISELENRLSTSVLDFNRRYEALLHNFEALAKASVSFDEIEKGLLILTRGLAEQVLLHLNITLSENEEFRKQVPRLLQAIKENDNLGTEIHNHFNKDSHCQVFNGPTSGQFGNKI